MMKILYLLILLLSLTLFSGVINAQKKTVTYPLYEHSNKFLRIDKLELDEKRVILHCAIRSYAPKDSKISLSSQCYLKGKSGTVYKLLKSEGIKLDEPFYSPQPSIFSLTFEPLRKDETIFDFVEGKDDANSISLTNIHTYKPEAIKPFTCKIKGTVVDQPGCTLVQFNPYNAIGDYIWCVNIPVKDGKFEYEREFNYEGRYGLYPRGSDPLNSPGKSSMIYVEPGVIEVTIYPQKSSKDNIVKAGSINEEEANWRKDIGKQSQLDTAVCKAFYDLWAKKDRNAKFIFRFNPTPWDEREAILTESAKKMVGVLQKYPETYTVPNVIRDSILIQIYKTKNTPGFYTDEAFALIQAINKQDKQHREAQYNYWKENISVVSFDQMVLYLSGLLFKYPSLNENEYHKFDDRGVIREQHYPCSKAEADAEIERYIDLFRSSYANKFAYHPTMEWIANHIEAHIKRKNDAEALFEACANIDLTPQPIKEVDDDNGALLYRYRQLRDIIEKALYTKDEEATKIINLFAEEYATQYPNHPITNEIKNMIRIVSDENNPNKWRKFDFRDQKPDNLDTVLNFLREYQDKKQKDKSEPFKANPFPKVRE